jgi:hypothetical protein
MMTLFDFFHVSKFSKINGKFPMDAPPITTTLDLTLVLLAQQKTRNIYDYIIHTKKAQKQLLRLNINNRILLFSWIEIKHNIEITDKSIVNPR